MDSSIPQQPPPEHVVGDPGAGWRRFARFGAVVYAITSYGNFDVLNRLACNLWLPGDPVTETLLRRLLFVSALVVGPVYFVFSSPRSLQPGIQRAAGTVVMAALWITGLLPLHYLFFDTASGVALSPWSFSCSAVYLFILLTLFLRIWRMHPAPRFLLLGSVPLAVAGVVLMAGNARIRQGVGGELPLVAIASMAILISWLFWCAYVQRHLYGDNLWWLRTWRRLDAFDPFHNKWIAAVSGDFGRKVARISAVACALAFVLFWSEFRGMSLPHPIDWPPGLISAMSWAPFLMLLCIGPLYATVCGRYLLRPGLLRSLGWGLIAFQGFVGFVILSLFVFGGSNGRVPGRPIGFFALLVTVLVLGQFRMRRLALANQLIFVWWIPLIFSFSLLAIRYFNSGMFAPGGPWPALRAIVLYSICLYVIGMGGFLWFLPSMQIKKRDHSNSSTTSGTGTSPAPPPVTESNP